MVAEGVGLSYLLSRTRPGGYVLWVIVVLLGVIIFILWDSLVEKPPKGD